MNLYKSILPVDERGFYGEFGGSFVPPELQKSLMSCRKPTFAMSMIPSSKKNSMIS